MLSAAHTAWMFNQTLCHVSNVFINLKMSLMQPKYLNTIFDVLTAKDIAEFG
jgi:hypothetical protein